MITARTKIQLVLASLVVSFAAGEVAARIAMPALGTDAASAPSRPSPFRYDARIGYELKPYALVETVDSQGQPVLERMNSDGLRGPEYAIPKPAGTFRILVIGDSVAQGLAVSYGQSWPQVLERMLNRQTAPPMRYEVINAGIGGYVSYQALVRLTGRGIKYQPDVVLVLVGWNDLIFSSVPYWTPRMDLTRFEQAFLTQSAAERPSLWRGIRERVYQLSYLARLIRSARNNVYHARRIRELIAQRQRDSGVPFNAQALGLYRDNLQRIYGVLSARGARMGIILWPALLTPDGVDDPDIHRRLLGIYSNFPLSTDELWAWYQRYLFAQRAFAARHPAVIVVDAPSRFAPLGKRQRLEAFVDLAHLTTAGNRLLADAVLQSMRLAGLAAEGP